MTRAGSGDALRPPHPGDWQRALIVTAAAGLIAAPGLVAPLEAGSVFDGGITSSAGTFILHGQVPYRDFWLLYGPLAGYVAAVLNAIFGNEAIVLRAAGLLLVMFTAGVGYRLIASVAPGIRGASVAVLAATIPVYFLGLDLTPWPLAMAFALLAIDVARDPRSRAQILAGAILGLAALARLDVGAYALIAVIIQTRSLRPILGAAVVFGPVAVLFLFLAPIQSLLEQLIWYPIAGPQAFRRTPGPTIGGILSGENPLSWLLYYLPVFLIIGAAVHWLRTHAIPIAFVGLAVLATMSRLQTVGRADPVHAAQAFVPGLLLVAYVISAPTTSLRRTAMAFGGMVLLGIAALPILWLSAPADPYDQALAQAASIVDSRTTADEPIFVGELTNTRVFESPIVVYFLADRPAGVRDTLYNPGITTTAATQERMVADLAARHVRYLVLDVHFAGCYETSNDSQIPGSGVLDAAIARDYSVIANLGAVVIMASRHSGADIVAGTVRVDPGIPRAEGQIVCPVQPALP